MSMVTIPTYGTNPRARPITSSRTTQYWPSLYRPRSSTCKRVCGRIRIAHIVVVALGQELDRAIGGLVQFDHSMHDGDVAAFDAEHGDVAGADRIALVVGEEEQIAAVERRLHAATEHHHDWTFAARHDHQPLNE